jgi:hypothetical protein
MIALIGSLCARSIQAVSKLILQLCLWAMFGRRHPKLNGRGECPVCAFYAGASIALDSETSSRSVGSRKTHHSSLPEHAGFDVAPSTPPCLEGFPAGRTWGLEEMDWARSSAPV